MIKNLAPYDIEVSPNYALVGIRKPNGKDVQFDVFGDNKAFKKKDLKAIRKLVSKHRFVGFNNHAFDDPMTSFILSGATTSEIYSACTMLIENRIMKWEAHKVLDVKPLMGETIDLIDVAPNTASLKLYGARVHSHTIQDLPYDPHQVLTYDEAMEVKKYNINDLDVTELVMNKLMPMLELRQNISDQYGIDVLSKSDPQIAEAIFRKELTSVGVKVRKVKASDMGDIDFKKKEIKALFKRLYSEIISVNDEGVVKIPSKKDRDVIFNRYGITLNTTLPQPQMLRDLEGQLQVVVNEVRVGSRSVVRYKAPDAVRFKRQDLIDTVSRLEKELILVDASGSPILPKWLADTTFAIGTSKYNVGLGGLHSTEKSLVVIPNKKETLGNVDVASYYPSLIMVLRLFPKQLTKEFLTVYGEIKKTRLDAKGKSKDQTIELSAREEYGVINDALKIVLNGSFGKYGSAYSFLYAPDLLLTITFTGQLYLLMLIEELEANKLKVVSSNTDGVEILYKTKKQKKLEKIVTSWEKLTGMDMEYGYYKGLYARDVNNYVAVYDGYVKSKGAYADPSAKENLMKKNSEYPIVFEAIRTYLLNGTEMMTTLRECKDVAQFLTSRQVTGGGVWSKEKFANTPEYDNYIANGLKKNMALEKRNEKYQQNMVLTSDTTGYLGKVVRWYYSTKGKPIYYKKSGNRVPKSEGAKPMMTLTKHIPKDLDYAFYMSLCVKHLNKLGVKYDH